MTGKTATDRPLDLEDLSFKDLSFEMNKCKYLDRDCPDSTSPHFNFDNHAAGPCLVDCFVCIVRRLAVAPVPRLRPPFDSTSVGQTYVLWAS